jgi:hypothetical protein
MGLSGELPGWLGTSIIAIVSAIFGFFGKRFFDWFDERHKKRAKAISELQKLSALLAEGEMVFVNFVKQVHRLTSRLEENYGEEVHFESGCDEAFFQMYDSMNEGERELFHVIRGTTMHSMHRINERLRLWVDEHTARQLLGDIFSNPNRLDDLEKKLMQLRLHLNGWFDKYETIFKTSEKRSMVFLEDEKKHGIGFPKGLRDEVNGLLKELRKI